MLPHRTAMVAHEMAVAKETAGCCARRQANLSEADHRVRGRTPRPNRKMADHTYPGYAKWQMGELAS